jgi:hypothetical protein
MQLIAYLGWRMLSVGIEIERVGLGRQDWSAIPGLSGSTMDPRVYDLVVWDDGNGEALYAGGWFIATGGVATESIARWGGLSWSALSGPLGNGTDLWVDAMEIWNDGSGEALFVGGGFTTAC